MNELAIFNGWQFNGTVPKAMMHSEGEKNILIGMFTTSMAYLIQLQRMKA